ncbi:MAG TPA: hypothetical protein VF629_10600 [Hymenobacter sp.]|jgi:hypothetical protein|uniref:hypothetical protein n=1 Tax=Hymenobacter sp. TaxID=1898978 RepID=UPI002EDB265E
MNLSTTHRLLALLTWAIIGLATGCQSARPSFSFQPIRQSQKAIGPQHPAPAVSTVNPEPAVAAVAPAEPALRPVARHRNRKASTLHKEARATAQEPRHEAKASVARPRLLFTRPHATAERGLGTTVFGILGLVVLPVALVGLLLSGGGLVWGILAGAAALAVLVAYLDPFGH